ncbi:hypothetical protein ABIB73_007559 [Bradyrhizobium sp. F1.4.3]|uniref:hypothetical protein n=1 Tax=unclassified Bradyrhizobium TaxID=2631580 RepID=UPI0033972B21
MFNPCRQRLVFDLVPCDLSVNKAIDVMLTRLNGVQEEFHEGEVVPPQFGRKRVDSSSSSSSSAFGALADSFFGLAEDHDVEPSVQELIRVKGRPVVIVGVCRPR